MCFDFRRARSHPLGPTITSRLPGRFAMYTSKEVRVKVADLPDAGIHLFQDNLPTAFCSLLQSPTGGSHSI
jgi:hypothetical protein